MRERSPAKLCCFYVFKWKNRGFCVWFDSPHLTSLTLTFPEGTVPQSVLLIIEVQAQIILSRSHSPTISFFSIINVASKKRPMVVVKLGPGLQIPTHCIPGAHSWEKATTNEETHTEQDGVRDRGRAVWWKGIFVIWCSKQYRGHIQYRYYLNPPSFGDITAYLSFSQRWKNLCVCTVCVHFLWYALGLLAIYHLVSFLHQDRIFHHDVWCCVWNFG